ncbi:MAG: hypothetical protein IJ685_02995 [Selenomonadaceae bacterium]|nr:hypothetical protein [Selenomonadaceae bacterium]
MENFMQLNPDEKTVLESVYGRQVVSGVGYNPRQLEAIKDLTTQEKKFFTNKNFVSPNFYVQTLYKVSGNINPMKFNVAVNRIINETENLRANFCNVGTRTIKVIYPKNIIRPEIVFRNVAEADDDELNEIFTRLLEADMRREFDLRHDPLIRFSVYKTSDQNFAVLVTLAQLISDSFDSEKFFGIIADVESKPKSSASANETLAKIFDNKAVREYWAKVLDNAPPMAKLPFERKANVGTYRQKAYRAKVPVDILSDLRSRAQSNQVMLTAILQSAWGFMLQAVNKRRDCLFCQILSENQRVENFSLNMIPVRLIGDGNLTVEKIVTNQFKQLVVSQPYSRVDWEDLQNLSTRRLFDHFLSFRDFRASEFDYVNAKSETFGNVVMRNSWDAQGMKLGAYFRYSEMNLTMTFLYDDRQFVASGVEKLFALYNLVLKQMLVDWNAKFPAFAENLARRMKPETDTDKISAEEIRKKIRDFLSQLPILQGRYEGTIKLFDGQAEIITRFEGDRISGDDLTENFIFVVDGKLARSVNTGDGWYNPLDIVKKNDFVNPTNFLDKPKLLISAEVLTEEAQLLTIPRTAMLSNLQNSSELALSMMNFALTQMEKYQRLWLLS